MLKNMWGFEGLYQEDFRPNFPDGVHLENKFREICLNLANQGCLFDVFWRLEKNLPSFCFLEVNNPGSYGCHTRLSDQLKTLRIIQAKLHCHCCLVSLHEIKPFSHYPWDCFFLSCIYFHHWIIC